MTGNDTRLLVVSGSVTGQLEDFGRKVLEDGSEVDGGTSTNSLCKTEVRKRKIDKRDQDTETNSRA